MCKPTDNITAKVEELMELRKMADELQAEMEAITDEIKAYMGDEETMMAGSWKVTYKETVSRRMDTTALKKDLGDALEGYQNPSRIRKYPLYVPPSLGFVKCFPSLDGCIILLGY